MRGLSVLTSQTFKMSVEGDALFLSYLQSAKVLLGPSTRGVLRHSGGAGVGEEVAGTERLVG